MQVILVEEVPSLGHIGEQVKVKDGYARNYLLPNKLAVAASTQNVRQLNHQLKVISFKAEKAREAAQGLLAKIQGTAVILKRKVGEQDKLYGSVTAHDVETALAAQGVEIDRRKIQLHEPIKALGEYEVAVRLQKDLTATLKVTVEAEEE